MNLGEHPPPAVVYDDTVPPVWMSTILSATAVRADVLAQAMKLAEVTHEDVYGDMPRVTERQEAEILEAIAALTENETAGLTIGLQHEPQGQSILAYIVVSSATLAEALHNIVRFVPLTRPMSRAHLRVREDGVALEWHHVDPLVSGSRQKSEFMAAAMLKAFRTATGAPILAREVKFAHTHPGGHNRIAAALGCPVVFGSDVNALEFSNLSLTRKILTADTALNAHLTHYGEMLLASRKPAQSDIHHHVERAVLKHIANGVPTAQRIALSLGMSERTLSRRLSEQDLTYRQIVDDLRMAMAERHLLNPNMTLAEIAFLLGFSDQSSFSTAHRRWTGMTPGQYRRQHTTRA